MSNRKILIWKNNDELFGPSQALGARLLPVALSHSTGAQCIDPCPSLLAPKHNKYLYHVTFCNIRSCQLYISWTSPLILFVCYTLTSFKSYIFPIPFSPEILIEEWLIQLSSNIIHAYFVKAFFESVGLFWKWSYFYKYY